MSVYTHTCVICGHKQQVGSFGNFTCEKCGVEYEYEEGQFLVLTPAMLDAIRGVMGIPSPLPPEGEGVK